MDHILISFLLGAIWFSYLNNQREIRVFIAKKIRPISRVYVKYTILNNVAHLDSRVFKPQSKR